jgi:hypothetical protein
MSSGTQLQEGNGSCIAILNGSYIASYFDDDDDDDDDDEKVEEGERN